MRSIHRLSLRPKMECRNRIARFRRIYNPLSTGKATMSAVTRSEKYPAPIDMQKSNRRKLVLLLHRSYRPAEQK